MLREIVEARTELEKQMTEYVKKLDKLNLSMDEWDRRYAAELERLRKTAG